MIDPFSTGLTSPLRYCPECHASQEFLDGGGSLLVCAVCVRRMWRNEHKAHAVEIIDYPWPKDANPERRSA